MYMSHYTSLHHLIRQIIYEYFSHYLQGALLSTLSARAKSNTCAATKANSDVKSDCRFGSWARRNETALPENEVEAIDGKPRLVDRDHAVDHVAPALAHAGHVQGPRTKAQSERRPMADELHDLRAVDHVLTGQAGNVGT